MCKLRYIYILGLIFIFNSLSAQPDPKYRSKVKTMIAEENYDTAIGVIDSLSRDSSLDKIFLDLKLEAILAKGEDNRLIDHIKEMDRRGYGTPENAMQLFNAYLRTRRYVEAQNLAISETSFNLSEIDREKMRDILHQNMIFRNEISLDISFNHFSTLHYDDIYQSYYYKRSTVPGDLLFSYFRARRITTDTIVIERISNRFKAEFYPKIGSKVYLYTAYSYSNGIHFPVHDASLDLYYSAPRGWELSVGDRFARYENGISVNIASLMVAKYWGNYYGYVRYYYSTTSTGECSSSYLSSVRRYWGVRNFISLSGSYGTKLDENILKARALDPDFEEFQGWKDLVSYKLFTDISYHLTPETKLKGQLGYERVELSTNSYSNNWSISAGVSFGF